MTEFSADDADGSEENAHSPEGEIWELGTVLFP